jgi:hypothetical protein
MLRSQAAQFRLQFSDRGPYPQSSGYTPPSLRNYLLSAQANPGEGHMGMDTGRTLGEMAYVIAQSVKKGAVENKPWCAMFVQLVEAAKMGSGIFSRCRVFNPADVWYDAQNDTAQAFEVPMLWMGGIGCSKVTGRPISSPSRFAEVLYEEAPMYPYGQGKGPPHYLFVARRGGSPYSTVTAGKGNGAPDSGDNTHVLVGCALAAHLNPAERNRWVQNARDIKPFFDMRESAGILAQQQLL